jgi:chemotaxis protein CheX
MDTIVKRVTSVLNETIFAIKDAVPLPVAPEPEQVKMISAPLTQAEIGVLIGLTGDVKGRLYLQGSVQTFTKIGEAMFGFSLSGEMLQSFVGEFGNIIGGGMATNVSTHRGLQVDITPPTVMVGNTQFYGFDKALSVPVKVGGTSELNVVLLLAEGKRSEWKGGKNPDHR